ncbi:alpha/beta fold hydrolase [Brucella pituitosa]|uniref:alpha/beta hydrolase n=1 Tax=Brucella pituitosa TaxID=571256 RepID=UPI001AECFC00
MMLLLASVFVFAAAALSSQEISVAGPFGELSGTWTKASDAAAPIVLIIPGSGPTDRDGNSPLGISAGSYRLLAEGLGAESIATVRFDKRGMFGSSSAVLDANAVTINDYVSDTRAWVEGIRRKTSSDCVWLLGHSEGGLVALATAQVEPQICGLILIATSGRPLGDVLKEQLRSNPANASILSSADTAINTLAEGKHVNHTELPASLASLFNPAIQDFLISIFTVDPAELARHVAKPILILQGERDLQIGIPDAMA